MGEWKEYYLDQIYHFSSGLSKPADQFGFGYPFLSFKEVFRNYFLPRQLMQLVNSTEKERASGSIKRGDVFITRTSETDDDLGMTSVALKDYPDATFNGFTKRMRPKGIAQILPEFAGYYFRAKRFQAEIAGMSSVTTRASLNNGMLATLKMKVPPVPEQKAIAEVLSSLDDKIDLLHRQNKTLESLAQTLFRQWFIEEAEDSWEEKSLFDVIDLVGGGTPKTDVAEYWSGDIKWISAKDITPNNKRFIVSTEKTISSEGFSNCSARMLPKFSTIISARGTVGKYCLLSEEMTFSQSNYGIKPRFNDCYFFTYLLIGHSVAELQSAAYGSVFDTITTNTFKEHKIKLPLGSEIRDFEESVSPYFRKMLSNQEEMGSLTKVRDSLLPKLMTGDINLNG